jgi:hypothetical protein
MTSARLNICEEGLLWKAALEFLGPVRLYQTVVDLWVNATSPSRSTVEYLAQSYVVTMKVTTTGTQKTLDVLIRNDVVINYTFSEGPAPGTTTATN